MSRLGKLSMLGGARSMAKKHPDKVHSGVDKLTGALKKRVGDKHSDKIDGGASKLKKLLTGKGSATGSDRASEDTTGDRTE